MVNKVVFKLFFFALLVHAPFTFAEGKSCQYGKNDTCEKGYYCVFVDNPNVPVCKKYILSEDPTFVYPFSMDDKTYCWKSVDSLSNSSHAWLNARFAIDLHSSKEKYSKIYSLASGRVVVSKGCLDNDPQCNGAFGNQVKVLLPNGIMLFYAHLSKISVKTGDYLQVGDLIGIEGATGNVGGMWGQPNDFHHLHFSVHYDWRSFDDEFHNNPWPGMPSIPFKLKVCDPKNQNTCDVVEVDVREFPCSKGNGNLTPIRGTIKR